MRIRRAAFVTSLAIAALCSAPAFASAQPITPTLQTLALPGSPFAVVSTPDGRYAFATLTGATSGIAIIRQHRTTATLVRVLPTGAGAWGLTITHDGRYLLDTVSADPEPGGTSSGPPQAVQIIDVRKAIAGQPGAIVATVPTPPGPTEVALSNDGRYAFAADEDNQTVSVIDLRRALASGGGAGSLVGNIPVEQDPVGLAFSPDGRRLYITSEAADPTDPGYDPTACNTPTGVGTGTTPGPQGTLTVVDLPKAERDPANSVVATDFAGCSPVRVVLSDHGRVAWVTARAENDVLAFSTRRLVTDPADALVSRTPVGVAPVGIQLFDHDRLIAVTDSNRFTPGQTGSVSILDRHKALGGAGDAATVGTFAAGQFPRQWGLSNDGRTLYLTEYSSNVLAVFPVRNLVRDVTEFDPSLSFGSPFGAF